MPMAEEIVATQLKNFCDQGPTPSITAAIDAFARHIEPANPRKQSRLRRKLTSLLESIEADRLRGSPETQHLSKDEAIAIHVYTLESPIYGTTNAVLRGPRRTTEPLRAVAGFVRLLIEGLRSTARKCADIEWDGVPDNHILCVLPGTHEAVSPTRRHPLPPVLYRMVRVADAELEGCYENYKEAYAVGAPVEFYGITSATASDAVANAFTRGAEKSILFKFHLSEAVDAKMLKVLKTAYANPHHIRPRSVVVQIGDRLSKYPGEAEWIFPPPLFCRVKGSPTKVGGCIVVELSIEIEPPFQYLPYPDDLRATDLEEVVRQESDRIIGELESTAAAEAERLQRGYHQEVQRMACHFRDTQAHSSAQVAQLQQQLADLTKWNTLQSAKIEQLEREKHSQSAATPQRERLNVCHEPDQQVVHVWGVPLTTNRSGQPWATFSETERRGLRTSSPAFQYAQTGGVHPATPTAGGALVGYYQCH